MLKFNSFPKHSLRGRKAQAHGKEWESIFHLQAVKQGLVCIRINDGCKSTGYKLIRVRQAFDFILSFDKYPACFIDTKTVKTTNYSASMVTSHQVADLAKLEAHGHFAGYLVNFTKTNQIVWFSATQLKQLTEGMSLKPSDGLLLGTEGAFDLKLLFKLNVTKPQTSP